MKRNSDNIAFVVAMARNRVIGRDNQLPWRLPADLRHFKHVTMGKPLLMGRKTFESIGRALPGRTNIVVTRDRNYRAAGCIVAHSLDEGLEAAGSRDEIMVIGGAELFERLLPRARRIYLTLIDEDIPGDVHFPELPEGEWHETVRIDHPADDDNPHPYSFRVLERIRND